MGADAYESEVRAADTARRPLAAGDLRRAAPSPARPIRARPRGSRQPRSFTLPVLSPGDRRAALRSLWSPFLPEAAWETDAHRARGIGARLPRRQRLDVRGDAARSSRCSGDSRPYIRRPFWAFSNVVAPARDRAGPAHRRHHRRHQHGLRARARGAHAAARGHRRHRRLHRAAQPGAGGSHRRHAPARHRHARRQRPRCSGAPASPTPSSRGCRHDPHERSGAAGPSGQVLRPGRRRHRRRVLRGRPARLLPGGDERLVATRSS